MSSLQSQHVAGFSASIFDTDVSGGVASGAHRDEDVDKHKYAHHNPQADEQQAIGCVLILACGLACYVGRHSVQPIGLTHR